MKQVFAADDYTFTFVVDDLEPHTLYRYTVFCLPLDTSMPMDSSVEASFQTAPAPQDAKAVSFVWAADLAGQGWGRNPDLSVTTPGGDVIQGGYVVFKVMEDLEPDFALFQGDMIYADNAIPATKDIPTDVGGGT